jgi:hypothetical protein
MMRSGLTPETRAGMWRVCPARSEQCKHALPGATDTARAPRCTIEYGLPVRGLDAEYGVS